MGKVQRITDFGAFRRDHAGTDGLLTRVGDREPRVKDVREELKEGEQLLVKVSTSIPPQDSPQPEGAPCRRSDDSQEE